MSDHIKPTKEELESRLNQNLKEIEDTEDNLQPLADGEAEEEQAEEVTEGEGEEEAQEELVVDEEEETPIPEEAKPKEETPPPPPPEPKPVDYEKRYKDSSREINIILESKDKENQEIDEAQNLPEPTDDEIRQSLEKDGITLEELSPFEKKLAKENLHQKLINNRIKEIRDSYKADAQKIEDRAKEVDAYSIHPDTLKQFPKLEGKQAEFVKYCTKPSRINMDLEDLAKLFILDIPTPVKNKGKMLEVGSGGDNKKPQVNKGIITDADTVNALRNNDYKKYLELLKSGKIQVAIE